jgi:hypothetical protein
MGDINITPITHGSTDTEIQPLCIQRRKSQMSLVFNTTQDRLIKREDGMERVKSGILKEIYISVFKIKTAKQMVRSIYYKMMGDIVSARSQVVS